LQSLLLIAKKILLFFKQGRTRAQIEERIRKFIQQIKINYLSYLGVIAVFGLILVIFQLIRLETDRFIGGLAWGQEGLFLSMLFLGTLSGHIAKNRKLVLATVIILVLYLAVKQSFYSGNLFFDIIKMTGNSLFYLIGIGLLGWLSGFYEKNSQNRNLHFAFWLFLGVILTIFINGTVFLLF
jgi:hypothetical protein